MENASKALIMAGAILIAILIISLSVYIFNNMSTSAKDSANMDKQEISNFNSKITPYLGENVTGTQVNSLIQLVISIDNAAVSSNGNINKKIEITFPGGGRITVNGTTVVGIDGPKRVETGPDKIYIVKETYDNSTGLINKITVDNS